MSHTTYPTLHISWLVESEDSSPASAFPASSEPSRIDYPFPPEVGRGWSDRILMTDDLFVYKAFHRFNPKLANQLLPLGEFKFTFPENTLGIQTVQGGTICHREHYPKTELIYKPGHDLFRYADRLHLTPLIDTSSDSEMTSLSVSYSVLRRLLGDELSQQVLAGLELTHSPQVKVKPIPLHITAPLHRCISPALTGRLLTLFTQAKVLEYLCLLAGHVSKQTSIPNFQEKRKQKVVHELHEYLVTLEGRLPSLDELSTRYGLSSRWLNASFSKEYGRSIYAFISDLRLNESHAALLEGNLAIKAISARMGYSHSNHFTTAFRKKFGYPPGSLRRRRQSD